jgi:hypothetical protein
MLRPANPLVEPTNYRSNKAPAGLDIDEVAPIMEEFTIS